MYNILCLYNCCIEQLVSIRVHDAHAPVAFSRISLFNCEGCDFLYLTGPEGTVFKIAYVNNILHII